jgi:hypothetical protein
MALAAIAYQQSLLADRISARLVVVAQQVVYMLHYVSLFLFIVLPTVSQTTL